MKKIKKRIKQLCHCLRFLLYGPSGALTSDPLFVVNIVSLKRNKEQTHNSSE
jgi:hypothetical protein